MKIFYSPLLCCLLIFLLQQSSSGRELPNILLLTVDTFRPDHIGAMGYTRQTSPNLDRIAEEGVLFTQAISSSSWTTPGLISILTGLYAPSHGVDVRGKSLSKDIPTLPRLLAPLGYVCPDVCYLTVIPNFVGLGFDPYPRRDSLISIQDEILFKAIQDYRDQRFFIYYHYRNLHLPYNPSPAYGSRILPSFDWSQVSAKKLNAVTKDVMIPYGHVDFKAEDREWVEGQYDGQILEMDERFIKRIEEMLIRFNLKDKTLLVITADHGEELLDHGFVGHASTSLSGNSYDEVIRIPLVFRYPGGLPQGRVVDEQVQNIDILPTILDILGKKMPGGVEGRSLVPLIRGEPGWQERPAYCETTPGGYQASPEMLLTRILAMRTSSWKLISSFGPSGNESELFHLIEDPLERQNLITRFPEIARKMQLDLDRWRLREKLSQVVASGDSLISDYPQGIAESEGVRSEADTDSSSYQKDQSKGESIRILFPSDRDTLRFEAVDGSISPRWTGDVNSDYTAEYRVAEGTHRFLEGRIPVVGNAPKYGPFGGGLWNTLALYNPWRFRVRRADATTGWSEWRTFFVEAKADSPHQPSSPFFFLMNWFVTRTEHVVVGVVCLGAGVLLYLLISRDRR